MLSSIDRFARWWIDGLADLLAAALPGRSGGRRFVVAAGPGPDHAVAEPGRPDRPVGTIRLGAAGATVEPAALVHRLAGAAIEIALPDGWLFRRPLQPVAAESAPYLDAFVRHQVGRVTPWRVEDTYFAVATSTLPDDPKRLAVELGVVPRGLAGPLVEALERLAPGRLTLAGAGFRVPLGPADGGRPGLRRLAGAALAGLVLATTAALAAGSWRQAVWEEDIAALDRLIAERRDVLRAAAERARPPGDPAEALRAQHAASPPVVLLLDELSAALPDAAHLTELRFTTGTLRLSGIAADVAALIPALEAAPHFRAVAFLAPSTRLPSGAGDRFHIELRVEPARTAEAGR